MIAYRRAGPVGYTDPVTLLRRFSSSQSGKMETSSVTVDGVVPVVVRKIDNSIHNQTTIKRVNVRIVSYRVKFCMVGPITGIAIKDIMLAGMNIKSFRQSCPPWDEGIMLHLGS